MMMIKIDVVYLLYFGIYLTMVYSYDDSVPVTDEMMHEQLIEDLTKLHRVKRAGPAGPTSVNYSPVSFTSIAPSPTQPPPPPRTMVTTQSTISPTYIISSVSAQVQTTQYTSQTNPSITNSMMTSTRPSTVPNPNPPYNPDSCGIVNYTKLFNSTCVPKPDGLIIAVDILRNRSNDATVTAHALSLYVSSITNSTIASNKTQILSLLEMDDVVNRLSNVNLSINSNTSFVTIQQPNRDDQTMILGASFKRGIGGEIVDTSNRENITKSFVSAAAIVSKENLNGVLFLNMLIIDKPTGYENADNQTNKILVSSIIIANLRRNTSRLDPIHISLYFNPLDEYKQNGSGTYLCSFYDTNTSTWSEFGCTNALYNQDFNRYDCSCNHTTSFALIWLPQSLSTETYTKQLDAQDIASLVFQFISILCFLAIIIHAIGIRIISPLTSVQALNLLPLISTASTTILFIFYIALTMTVYTQTSSADQMECFLSSNILMFITYFLLIFMFCVKTTTGYFYFLRFVRLFPHPSHRKLLIMLIISVLISSLCTGLAIGFNTNSSYDITQLYPYKLCWFTRHVIYYFLTIPIGLFLCLNILTIIFVSKSIITHARHAATPKQMNERLKRCVIVLLSSCVTQGIGWIFGPFISLVSTTAGNILGWIFILLNGLEGVWSIFLYVLIRSQQMDEQKHIAAAIELSQSTTIPLNKDKRSDKEN